MSKGEANIIDGLKAMARAEMSIALENGTVLAGSVNEEKLTCTIVDIMGTEITDVLLNVIEAQNTIVYNDGLPLSIEGNFKGICAIPEDNSHVAYVATETGYLILKVSDIKKIVAKVSDATFFIDKVNISSDNISINQGQNGGLVIVTELLKKLNKLETEINKLKNTFTGWTPVASDGGAALKTLLIAPGVGWATQSVAITQLSDIENEKFKH